MVDSGQSESGALFKDDTMTATIARKKNEKDRFVEEFVARLMRLPKQKVDRLSELQTLFGQASNEEEEEEILDIVVEIIEPALIGMDWPKNVIADFESGVGNDAIRKVGAYRKQVGQRIKQRRKNLGMSQDDLAEKAGIPQSHVSRLERGVHAATDATIERVAKALGVEPGDIDPACDV
jgi:DNA-binding XRE family transcriptional regulator